MNKQRIIIHVDFNSYFATIEQQANPRLRGKPIAVTGGDRTQRTVVGAASVEAKKRGVKTGMAIWEARQLCPEIILVPGESEKYLECSKRFMNILKNYSPFLEIFSIDESFLEIPENFFTPGKDPFIEAIQMGEQIKEEIHRKIGSWVSCSVGISYNKLMAKLASNVQKPNGLVVIADTQAARIILDQLELDEICGIGYRIKNRLYNLGITNFKQLREAPLPSLLAAFKSYGQKLHDMAGGVDHAPIVPFYDKEQVKSVGHQHTIHHDTYDPVELKQLLLKLTELVARRLRAKKLMGKTVHFWFRRADFTGDGMQVTIPPTQDGLLFFEAAWKAFNKLWYYEPIRFMAVSISNLQPATPRNLSLLEESLRQDKIIKTLDKINNQFGEFTLQRGILLHSTRVSRKANSFLSDRRFQLQGN